MRLEKLKTVIENVVVYCSLSIIVAVTLKLILWIFGL